MADFVNQLEETFEAGTSVQGVEVMDGGGKRLYNFAPGTVLNTSLIASSTDASATGSTDLAHLVTTYSRVDPASRIYVTANANARYVENSDDPGISMKIQYSYDGGTVWTALGDSVVHQNRFADRGTANYNRGTLVYTAGINGHGNDSIMFRMWVYDAGGTATSTKTIYNASFLFQEVTQNV
jgi:hypothetical protein